jgi:hypothetical protein
VQAVQRDLLYVRHFPKGEKYVALLRDAQDPAAQQHVEQERARLRALVAQQLAEQAAVTEADEGAALASGLAAGAAAAAGGTGQPAAPAAAKATKAAPPATGTPGAAAGEHGKQQKQGKRGREDAGAEAQQGAARGQARQRGAAQAPPPALLEQEVRHSRAWVPEHICIAYYATSSSCNAQQQGLTMGCWCGTL